VDLTSFEFADPLHGADAEIATVRDLPFVVLFGEQRPDKPQQRRRGWGRCRRLVFVF
jgi:hypothetical protein